MAVIIPPDSFYKKQTTPNKTTIYLYFKKEISINNEKDIETLINLLKEFYKRDLFDDIYISKTEIENVQKIKDIYTVSVLNDMKFVKEEVATLKDVVKKLIIIVKQLKNILEQYNR